MDAHRRLLREVRDAVYLLDGEGIVVEHNGRLPPGVEASDAPQFNDRMPEPLRLEFPLEGREARTDRIRYRDALHYPHVVRRRLVPMDDSWACLIMAETNPDEATRLEFLGRLVLHVAHDLNNMLTAIVGHADLIASELGEHVPEREWVSNLRVASRQAARFTHRLMAFGHGGPARPRVVELNEHVADAARMIRRLLPPGTGFVFEPAVGEVQAHVDPGHLDQALLALAAGLQDILVPGGQLRLRVDPAPGVTLEASALREPDLEPSFGALEFARARVRVATPRPGAFVLTPIP